jgi:hypothetical protein
MKGHDGLPAPVARTDANRLAQLAQGVGGLGTPSRMGEITGPLHKFALLQINILTCSICKKARNAL